MRRQQIARRMVEATQVQDSLPRSIEIGIAHAEPKLQCSKSPPFVPSALLPHPPSGELGEEFLVKAI